MHPRFVVAAFVVSAALYGQETKTAGEAYKNVTQLKSIPADQLGPTMQFMAAALGVNCEFCHVQGKMDADEKGAKRTAREMIAMTMEINKASFRGQVQVSCYTCHRGSARPVGVPPVIESDTPAKTEARPPMPGGPGATADQILEKWVTALGGADALHKVTSRVLTGKILANGSESPIEVLTKAPNKRISITHMPGGNDSYTAFDGTEGWMGGSSNVHQARVMSPAESAASSIDAEFYLPLRLKEVYPQLRRGRPEEINGAMCDALNASAPGKPALRLFFDQKTGLLVRMVRYAETPVGRMPTQIDYADYRDAGGAKIPFRWTLSRPNGRFTIQIAEAKVNGPIDDAKFARPQ